MRSPITRAPAELRPGADTRGRVLDHDALARRQPEAQRALQVRLGIKRVTSDAVTKCFGVGSPAASRRRVASLRVHDVTMAQRSSGIWYSGARPCPAAGGDALREISRCSTSSFSFS